jgi:hypothetical protein
MSVERRGTLKGLAILGGLALISGSLFATIFLALPSALEKAQRDVEERLGIKKSVDTSFGTARVDESKDPPEIALGELRSLWKGIWQLNGAKLEINRAQATDLVLQQSSARFKFRVRWVAGNEAVARSAKHTFRMRIYRVGDGDKETLVESVDKDVTVGGKGVGGTAFKNGQLSSSEMKANGPAKYRVAFEVKNTNTGASLGTSTYVELKTKT